MLEPPHAGLTGVVRGDRAQRVVGEHDLVLAQRGPLELATHEVVPCDVDLLVLGVAVEPDDLHPVEERGRDRLGHVGRRDEEDLGQVEVDLEVVIAERVVLRGVEHLEQRRRRIAAVVRAELVDLVEQQDGVHRPGLAHRPGDAAGLGADVGATVPADLRLVVDAAERDADEGPSERPGDRLPERGLADARRTDEGEDRAGAARADGHEPALGCAACAPRCAR